MPIRCTTPESGWPAPWPPGLEIPANLLVTGNQCAGLGTNFHPALDTSGSASYPAPAPTGWEVGARPSSVTITLTSPAIRNVSFNLRDVLGGLIGSVNHACPVGSSTAVITTAFGSSDIGYLETALLDGGEGLNDMLVTSIDVEGFTSAPAFWTSFKGQYEA